MQANQSNQIKNDLAKFRSFLDEMMLYHILSVAVRENKSQGKYYALIAKMPDGKTKTIHKSYNIEGLVEYMKNNPRFTAPGIVDCWNRACFKFNNNQGAIQSAATAIANNTEPENKPMKFMGVELEEKPEWTDFKKQFSPIKRDIVRAIALAIMNESVSYQYEMPVDSIIDYFRKFIKNPDTVKAINELAKNNEDSLRDELETIIDNVISEIDKRGKTVYNAGICTNPHDTGEVMVQWYSCNKDLIEGYAKDFINEHLAGYDGDERKAEAKYLKDRLFTQEVN